MKNKKYIINTLIILVITSVVLYFALKDNFDKTLHIILNANKLLILLVIVIMLVAFSLQSYGLYKIAKEYNNELSFKDIFKQIIIVQFFNGITPFSTGGQPMQVYMLNKSGLSIANSTITILQNSILFQVALVLCGILAVWRMRRGCQYLGRMRWQIALTALVSSSVVSSTTSSPNFSSLMLVMAYSIVR